jgi:ATP sulfurylase
MKRFPKRVLKRYADLILRFVYQSGGRDRYVLLDEVEHELGLEPHVILELCRTRLLGEIQISNRVPVAIEEHAEFRTPVERQLIWDWFERPHLRIRPEVVRLTADELVRVPKRRAKQKKKKRSKSRA